MRREYRASPEFTVTECLALLAILATLWGLVALLIWLVIRALKGG